MAKTAKSKGLDYLTKAVEDGVLPQNPKDCLVIEDGNAVFYYLKEVPGTFGDIARKVFNLMNTKSNCIFSTDMYKEYSVKSVERRRRGCGEKLIVRGESTRRPKDWKEFLSNDQNKEQFIDILLKSWSSGRYSECLKDREVMLICQGRAFKLTSDGETTFTSEIGHLHSTQEETDSRVVLYCMYARDQGYQCVRIRSPDSDIFFILLHYVSRFEGITILFETGHGNAKRCLNVTDIAKSLTPVLCESLLSMHAFTGCDSTSAFKGVGKVKPIKQLEKSDEFQEAFAKIGDSWTVSEDVSAAVERFTCKSVNELRYMRLDAKCSGKLSASTRVDIGSLPPCQSTLQEHLKRVNFQVGIWKRAHVPQPELPDPTCPMHGHGWTIEDGVFQPKWSGSEVLPHELADILETIDEDEESDSDEDGEEDEDDFDDTSSEDSDDSD
jgi:hypothetical protein